MKNITLPYVELPREAEELRIEVREFLSEELRLNHIMTRCDSWLSSYSSEFSRKLGARGWLGMTWPKKYGGHERTAFERYVLTEEMLSVGAPVSAHWIADRQTGPLLLKYGTEEQRMTFLPKIAKGEIYFAIGLSEPNAGSDLAALSTKAVRSGDRWIVNGSKIWTSGAHHAHYMVTLLRTSPLEEGKKHAGLSQMIIDLNSPGVTIRPIYLMTGEHHFNEVIFEDVEVSDSMIVGTVGEGWKQGMAELAYERSGPERFMSTYPLLQELIAVLQNSSSDYAQNQIGKLISRLWVLRRMSLGVAKLLDEGKAPNIEASVVKDLGTAFEKEVIEVTRNLLSVNPSLHSSNRLEVLLAESILHAPGFTLRGGTTEILRSIISRGVGV